MSGTAKRKPKARRFTPKEVAGFVALAEKWGKVVELRKHPGFNSLVLLPRPAAEPASPPARSDRPNPLRENAKRRP